MAIFNARKKGRADAAALANDYNIKYDPTRETFEIYSKADPTLRGGTDLMVAEDGILPRLSLRKRAATKEFQKLAMAQAVGAANKKSNEKKDGMSGEATTDNTITKEYIDKMFKDREEALLSKLQKLYDGNKGSNTTGSVAGSEIKGKEETINDPMEFSTLNPEYKIDTKLNYLESEKLRSDLIVITKAKNKNILADLEEYSKQKISSGESSVLTQTEHDAIVQNNDVEYNIAKNKIIDAYRGLSKLTEKNKKKK